MNEGQLLFLGPDQNGVPLEVAGVEGDDGVVTVFHAMRMRRGYLAQFEETMGWR